MWKYLIVQGRSDSDEWVTSFKVSYSVNGKKWDDVANGKNITGNNDRNQKIKISFS
jgi:hypothetical protein